MNRGTVRGKNPAVIAPVLCSGRFYQEEISSDGVAVYRRGRNTIGKRRIAEQMAVVAVAKTDEAGSLATSSCGKLNKSHVPRDA